MDSQSLSARRASPLSPPPCAHLSASVFIRARSRSPAPSLSCHSPSPSPPPISFQAARPALPPSSHSLILFLLSVLPLPPSLPSRRSSFPSASIPPLSPSLSSSFSCRLQEVSVRFVRVWIAVGRQNREQISVQSISASRYMNALVHDPL